MNLANYEFLPWLRQGISERINEKDELGKQLSNKTGRPTVDISLTIYGMPVRRFNLSEIEGTASSAEQPDKSNKLVHKSVEILGPGDVTGIKGGAVVKTEPRPGVGNFEPNYLPYIEFYEEDFPWRYSPASENNEKLRPWLLLLALEEDEFERRFLPGAPLPAIAAKTPGSIPFPPADETWAWAHVHANRPLDGADKAASLQALVEENPNLASSRLLCPRRLRANTRYTAFLLPAFEQGRLAGLGASADRILSEDIQANSWGHQKENEYNNLWPVYYEWSFQTSDLEDFEYLVRRIEARRTGLPVGQRPVDAQEAGYELSYRAEKEDDLLKVEGALQILNADEGRLDFLNKTEAGAFINGLQEILNLNDPSEAGAENSPDQTLYTDGTADDPFVTPPLYGQWPAGKTRVGMDPDKPWFRELNLDPRNRIAAGFGALVVRKNQDAYMDRAWEQAADILEAQRLIRRARFSAETDRRLQEQYFNGMDDSTFTAFTSSMHSRSPYSNSGLAGQAVRQAIRQRKVKTAVMFDNEDVIRGDLKEEREKLKKAKARLKEIQQQIADKQREIDEARAAIQEANDRLPELEDRIEILDRQIEDIERLERVISSLEEDIRNLKNDLAQAQDADKPGIQQKIDEKEEDFKKAQTERDELPEDLAALEAEKEEKDREVERLENARDAAKDALPVLEQEMIDLNKREGEAEDDIRKIEGKIEELKRKINRLSILELPTAVLRQDYRKVARVTGPVLRRATGTRELNDAVIELGKNFEDVSFKIQEGTPEAFDPWATRPWEELNAGADNFKKIPAASISDEDPPQQVTVTTAELKSDVGHYISPDLAHNTRLRQAMKVNTRAAIAPVDSRTRSLITYPEFKEATYEALAEISSELMLPNVQLIPMDTFSLLEVNRRFIESYLIGLNHEMARELLWREFPTDQRGSYFRTFWDDTDNLKTTLPPPDIGKLTDIDKPLGDNFSSARPGPTNDEPQLVFVIRSELLKKFPNALVYMQKAASDTPPRGLTEGRGDRERKMPIFQAKIDPEISFFGFQISAEEAIGQGSDPGWFFIVQERPGEPRFGLDIGQEDEEYKLDELTQWNDLTWKHIDGAEHKDEHYLSLKSIGAKTLRAEPGSPEFTWKRNSAHTAAILLQLPFRAAVHASDMVKQKEA